MSQNDAQVDLDQLLKKTQKFFVLFYASWCPFSRKFLPIYEKCTTNNPIPCLRMIMDDKDELCDKYAIEFFPTVLLFENGEVSKRLDAEPGAGLTEKQLKSLLSANSAK